MLCQNKAVNLGIRTARLPIGTFLADLPTRKVLTVNQVFEILAQYVGLQDWAKAFEAVIPQRKYEAVGRHAQKRRRIKEEQEAAGGGAEGAEDGDEGAEEGVGKRENAGANDADAMDEEEAMNAQ